MGDFKKWGRGGGGWGGWDDFEMVGLIPFYGLCVDVGL